MGRGHAGGSRGESVPYLFQLLVAADIPCLVVTPLQSLPPALSSSSMLSFSTSFLKGHL